MPSKETLVPTQRASSELLALRRLVKRIDGQLCDILSRIGDEGDRAYLGSTNDVDTLKELMRETEREVYRIMEAEGD